MLKSDGWQDEARVQPPLVLFSRLIAAQVFRS